MNLRLHRSTLGLSQSKLVRLSGVSRFKICTFELGSGSLTPEERHRIKLALEEEAARLRLAVGQVSFPTVEPTEQA